MPMSGDDRGPNVPVPPPLVFLAVYVAAWLLNRRLEFLINGSGAGAVQLVAGSAGLAAGTGLVGWAVVTLVRARTSIQPHRPARQLVTWGPYRFTRNPIYVGLVSAYLGFALVRNEAWPLALLPLVIATISVAVIPREERYLGRTFPIEYEAYRQRARRWL